MNIAPAATRAAQYLMARNRAKLTSECIDQQVANSAGQLAQLDTDTVHQLVEIAKKHADLVTQATELMEAVPAGFWYNEKGISKEVVQRRLEEMVRNF